MRRILALTNEYSDVVKLKPATGAEIKARTEPFLNDPERMRAEPINRIALADNP